MWTLVEPDNTSPDSSGNNDSRHDRSSPGTLASRLPDLDDAAVTEDLASAKPSLSLGRIVAGTALSLMLAASLLAQIGYRHLDRISQHETMRPWLLTFCDVARCVLPIRQDSNMIISQGLSIEPHPDYQNVSQMALSFTNTADFPQPLPAIELVYSDIDGQEIAGRRFYPRHYLSETSTISAAFAMAAGQSLTTHLEFANPTADAVNYHVRFIYE